MCPQIALWYDTAGIAYCYGLLGVKILSSHDRISSASQDLSRIPLNDNPRTLVLTDREASFVRMRGVQQITTQRQQREVVLKIQNCHCPKGVPLGRGDPERSRRVADVPFFESR